MRLLIRRYRGWLLTVVVVAVLGVAAHWVFHYQVAARLDQWFAALPESMSGRYLGLTTDLRGRVVIEGVQLEGGGLPGPLVVARVDLEGPSLWRYLADSLFFTGVAPPRHLDFELQGIELVFPPTPPAVACEVETAPALAQLGALGKEHLTGRGEGWYRYDPDRRRLQGRGRLDVPGVGKLAVQAELSNVTPEGFEQAALGAAALKKLKLDLDISPALGMRLVEQCAREKHLAPAAYRDHLAGAWLKGLENLGVVADSGLHRALTRLVTDWGRVELTLVPPAPLTVALIPFVPRDQLPEKSGLRVALNGVFLPGVRLAPTPAAESPAAPRSRPAALTRQRLPKPARATGSRPSWRQVSLTALPRYLGRVVRLHESGRPPRSGLLEAVADGEALVRQRLRSGHFVAHVPLDRLERAEVLAGSR